VLHSALIMSNNILAMKSRPSSSATKRPDSPKKNLQKRKSLLTIIPWLSTRTLEDDDDDFDSDQVNAPLDIIHESIPALPSISEVPLVEHPDQIDRYEEIEPENDNRSNNRPTNLNVNDRNLNERNDNTLTDTIPINHNAADLMNEIKRLEILNDRLSAENRLYDTEMNKALNLNMQLESTVIKLEESLTRDTQFEDLQVARIPNINYEQLYKDTVEKMIELKEQKESLRIETDDIIQNYNSLVDKYFQIKEIHTNEKV